MYYTRCSVATPSGSAMHTNGACMRSEWVARDVLATLASKVGLRETMTSPGRVSIRHPHTYTGARRSLDQETLDYYGIEEEVPRVPPKADPPPRPSRANTAPLDADDGYDEPEMITASDLPPPPNPSTFSTSSFSTRARSATSGASGKSKKSVFSFMDGESHRAHWPC